MKKDTSKKRSKLGLGIALTGIAAGVGATVLAVLKQKKREEIYHEAELKAMNELDDLMNECDGDDCSSCSCAEECAAAEAESAGQQTFDDVDEDDEEPEVEVEVITDADDELDEQDLDDKDPA